jgi:group II intron reverse transcriptase/maturase
VEKREEQVNEAANGNRKGALTPETLSTKLNRLSEQARSNPELKFHNIAHLISVPMLEWSFQQLRKDAAVGVDGVTADEYGKSLESNLNDLHQRLKAGQYRAQPLRRVYIEKEDGKKRPLSILSLEDKIIQCAATELLTRIYENDFLPFSYGYRPGRSAHDALDDIQKYLTLGNANYVLDADISDYFGSIVRKQLMEMLQKRITDKNLLRLIGKWLNVGVIDEGSLLLSENGTYQGSIVSPVLANLYLHEVLDLWVKDEVMPRLRGEMRLYRYADDFIATFELKEDAERFLQVLQKRFEKFGLTLHPDKTRLIEFGRGAWAKGKKTQTKPATFNFLGFTHYCGTSQKGKYMVKVKTMAKRLRRSIVRINDWCCENRHKSIPKQIEHLRKVLSGHYAYYGRRDNFEALVQFLRRLRCIWKKWLSRRGRYAYVTWEKLDAILSRHPLPKPRIVHGSLSSRSQIPLFGEYT